MPFRSTHDRSLAAAFRQARDCDFVFLAVGGDFAKEYAEKLTEGVRKETASIRKNSCHDDIIDSQSKQKTFRRRIYGTKFHTGCVHWRIATETPQDNERVVGFALSGAVAFLPFLSAVSCCSCCS